MSEAGGRSARGSLLALLAAWLGWGFDVFDALLFSYVARPTFASLVPGATDADVNQGIAVLSSLFLVGWATGGIVFGRVTDRLGRTRTLLLTMLLYSIATAACALAPNVYVLGACRFVASLGVGGEWAAGASLVSETLPERWRVWGGALLFTASPAGLLLANAVNQVVVRDLFAAAPDLGWRVAFAVGLLPALLAFGIRVFVREPESFRALASAGAAARGRMGELFTPALRRRTWTGLGLATAALLLWWSVGVFLPKLLPELGRALGLGADGAESFASTGNDLFNLGGVIGALATAPLSMYAGRRPTLAAYFAVGGALLLYTFGLDHDAATLHALLFMLGFTIYGIFGVFAFYLPELFPVRLRGTGSGFCYNTGRYLAAVGPLVTGSLSQGAGLRSAIASVAVFALVGVLIVPFAVETRGIALSE